MRKGSAIYLLIMLTLIMSGQVSGQISERPLRLEKKALRKSGYIPDFFREWSQIGKVSADSISINKTSQVLNFYLSPAVTQIPARTEWIKNLREKIYSEQGRRFRSYTLQIWASGRLLEDYIPNAYRDSIQGPDKSRFSKKSAGPALVTREDQPLFVKGLSGTHIALWPSHGFFFDQQLDRWQWQRARLWQTVEDIFPWSFTSAYLIPMLENSGANVLLPRERDTQVHEVIVDNDSKTGASQLIIAGRWETAGRQGFKWADTLLPRQNPFEQGTALVHEATTGDTSSLTYLPDIPVTGDYAVYISYSKSEHALDKVLYEVHYAGGKAGFSINQRMGGSTWVYLGTFHFNKGMSAGTGSVTVSGAGSGGTVSSDAVRFGGGMGNVVRKPLNDSISYRYKISGKPRWMEGARYYLQYSGMPDSLIYDLNAGKNDYNDDYMSRGEWVNYLIGASARQYTEKYANGAGIPVDLALAFHTDAGITSGDSIIGTLGIYSTARNKGIFPDGRSKLASRDLSDIIQTQVVEDIRKEFDPNWTRRGLWDREYSEAWRPAVPTMLLELLSHQNLADMKLGLDPRFKFAAARAVYKGILRYMASEENRSYVVQPLPPDHMAIEALEGRKIRIRWRPVADPVEPAANPNGYKLYMKTEDEGFDTGTYTQDTVMTLTLQQWKKIYSYRVTALNEGGESMPGETLSASIDSAQMKPVLIINAFDRICAPAFFDKGDMAGIAWWEDEGVPDGRDFSFSGHQYDFNRNSEWISDDNQGWGASNADMETVPVAGNNHSFPLIHGKALRDAGYSFVSTSNEAFETADVRPGKYAALDVIFGEQRGTDSYNLSRGKEFRVFTPALIHSLKQFARSGGNIFISGAYIGTDMTENKDSLAIRFASDVLHYIWRTNHATTVGDVYATDQGLNLIPDKLCFNTDSRSDLYRVESPDAIEPVGKGAFRICRYTSGNCSAGVAYKGNYRSIALGFPFETITDENLRNQLMKHIMTFFTH